MCTGNWTKLCAKAVGLFLLYINFGFLNAEEITVFKITDIQSHFGLNYRYDADLTHQDFSSESKETRSIFEEEINVQTQSFIYHPNLLKLDLGAALLLSQENLETITGSTEHDDTLTGLNARLMFLEKKPYPLTLFYNKSHPSVALDVSDVFVQENERYGMNFSLREPVSPVSLDFETYNQKNKGSSFSQTIDDRNSYKSVRSTSSFDSGGYAKLSFSENKQNSMSGLNNMPIQPFNLTTETTNLNSLLVFGMQREINFNLLAMQTIQKQDRELDELRLSPRLTWEHSRKLNSFYNYNFIDRKQLNIESQDRSGSGGLRYQWNKNLNSNAELHFSNNKTTGSQVDNYGASGAVSYKKQLDIGVLQFNVGLNYNDNDRVVSGVVQVLDEQHTLTTASSFTLRHDYADRLSITIRRVADDALLTEGTHYTIDTIGKQTRITAVPHSGLPYPVLVNYQYDPGGDAAYYSIGQSYQSSLEFYQHFTVFLNYRDQEQTLESGTPTLPLGSSDTTSYGVRVNYPLPIDTDITLGGEITSEEHNENISSYQRNSADIFMQMALPLSSDLYLSMQQQKVDNIFSTEDVDLTRYSLRLTSHPANRFTITLQLSDEKDIGASLPRSSQNITLNGQWRIRKLLLELAARRVSDTHGTIKYERTIFNLNLRRDF